MDREQLIRRMEEGETFRIYPFYGHVPSNPAEVDRSCLSQWFPAPFEVDGDRYPTAEHWMMASKARLFGDHEALAAILAAAHPREAKAIGRSVRGYDEVRWRDHRFEAVVRGNVAKFEGPGTPFIGGPGAESAAAKGVVRVPPEPRTGQRAGSNGGTRTASARSGGREVEFASDPRLAAFLLGTGDRVLVEAAPRDRIWGVGLGLRHPDVQDPRRWRGANLLGFALMEVRRRLSREEGVRESGTS